MTKFLLKELFNKSQSGKKTEIDILDKKLNKSKPDKKEKVDK
jgi:hypothetical protein